jgi:Tol biopolymer transport system component
MDRMRRVLFAALLFLVVTPAVAASQTRYDPRLRFRSITTAHFVIHYHQGEEALAQRLAALAEDVHAELTVRMQHAPRGRTHVILVDQTDEPNGWATPVPYNMIEVTAAPPAGVSIIGHTSDWLRLVFRHEYVHVLHLDQSRGWARAARTLFGRAPFAFPNLALPLWQIEGLATWEESRDGEGRVPAGDFHAVVRHPAQLGRIEPLDRMNGGLVDWPTGWGWYAYGAYFHRYLAERFGEDRLVELARHTAGRVPYTTGGAFTHVFGVSLRQLWREFQAAEAAAAPTPGSDTATRLTRHGYLTDAPRLDVDGTIVYTRRDAHDFPALMRLDGERSARITSRFGGRTIAPAADAIYFDQLEFDGVVGLVSDLYRWDRATGAVRRLSRGARLAEPDVSPDGRRFAAVHVRDGARRLVIGDIAALERGGAHAITATIGDDDTVFATPRWSPDGMRIVAEHRRLGALSQIALVDPSTAAVTVLTSGPRGRHVTPAWAPDGRSIAFASDRDGAFQLYRIRVDDGPIAAAPDRLTDVPGGARTPMFSRDGRSIVYVGYTIDGYDLFQADTDRATATSLPPAPQVAGAPATPVAAARTATSDVAPSVPYTPWGTLAPRLWLPILENETDEWRIGAATGGTDALGYHAWGTTATWSVLSPADLAPVTPGARPNVTASYAYARWRPTLFAQFTDETTPLFAGADDARRPLAIQERRLELGTYVPFRRVRWRQAALAAYSTERTTFTGPRDDRRVDRGALRLGWAFDSTRRYGYSISRVDGISAGLTTEVARPALGADGSATFTRADVRGYLPLWPRHGVLAVRASGAASQGDATARRLLRLGGHQGEAGVMSFSEDATSLLRGFAANTFLGSRVVLVNAEYRVPIAYVERGVRTWPVFLRALHANTFVDVGHAWDGPFRWADRKWSWGGELAADAVVGYALPMTVAGGIAWGRDGAGTVPDTRRVYVRVGHGF